MATGVIMEDEPIVVIGAGNAGFWVAENIVMLNPSAKIRMFSEENVYPYDRPPVSKGFLLGTQSPIDVALSGEDFYEKFDVEIQLDEKIIKVDPQTKTITSSNGSEFTYGQLIIATGARPREIRSFPGSASNVHYLRSYNDAIDLRKKLTSAKSVAIIGGGFIGLEVAAAAQELGCEVVVFEAQREILGRVAPNLIGARLREFHESRGVSILVEAVVEDVEFDFGRVSAFVANNTRYTPDIIVVGIGAAPNSELAEGSGIVLNEQGAIIVDETMRTNVRSVFAIGDVACVVGENGKERRRESWDEARVQAAACARAITKLGETAADEVAHVPWFWTDQYDLTLMILGEFIPTDSVAIIFEESRSRFIALAERDSVVSAAFLFNYGFDLRNTLEGMIANQESFAGCIEKISARITNKISDGQVKNSKREKESILSVGLFLCNISEVPDNEMIEVYVPEFDFRFGVARIKDEVFVFENKCNHGNAWLSEGEVVNREVECPFHGGRFDLRTGEATFAPCKKPMRVFRTVVGDDGAVVIPNDETAAFADRGDDVS